MGKKKLVDEEKSSNKLTISAVVAGQVVSVVYEDVDSWGFVTNKDQVTIVRKDERVVFDWNSDWVIVSSGENSNNEGVAKDGG